MSTLREDAWKPEEDTVLAQIILEHIRNQSTQLKAFEEASERLGRTSAACGFRWNAELRKHFKESIIEAKEIRKTTRHKPEGKVSISTHRTRKTINPLDNIMDILSKYKKTVENMEKQIKELKEQLEQAVIQNAHLSKQLEDSKTPEEKMTDDYKNLLQILTRARELGILEKIS